MNNAEMKKYAIKTSVFAIVSISLMLYRSATKHIMITDAAETPVDRGNTYTSYNLLMSREIPEGKQGTLIIPLDKSVSSDNIVLEDRYVDHELRIYIDSRETDYYKTNPVVTDLNIIENAVCVSEGDEGNVCLDFKLKELYVNESSLTETSTIEVKFYNPAEKFDHIVVVDDETAGEAETTQPEPAEKDTALDTALLLKSMADKDTENNVKVYVTRLSSEDVDLEKRQALVRDSGADLLVEFAVEAQDGAGKALRAGYNDSFFLRRLSNADFADIMLRNCAYKSGTDGVKIVSIGEEDLLIKNSVVPSAKLMLTGTAEALSDQAYRKKLAEGIYSGILEAFEVME